MAIMIPGMQYKDLQKDFNGSVGELRLYELLEQLPNDFYVLHSTSWNEQRRRNELSPRKYVQWGEADFTVYHPEKGIIVFEVKDGLISYSRERGCGCGICGKPAGRNRCCPVWRSRCRKNSLCPRHGQGNGPGCSRVQPDLYHCE